jgi:ELWxxDGT repeat protein
MKQVYKLFIAFVLIYFSTNSVLRAQNFQVLDVNKSKDGNPSNGGFSNYYDQAYSKFEYAVLNGVSYFAADDGIHGTELWKSDGTASGTTMVKDVYPGNSSSNVHDITVSGNKIYFAANDGVHGLELWVTDGTRTNTKIVKDIYGGSVGSSPAYLIDGDGELYFFVNNILIGDELWKSDGTKKGTVKIASFFTPDFNYSQYGNQLTYVNGRLFFAMNGGSGFYYYGDQELWTSDGTLAGTFLVKQINPYSGYGFSLLFNCIKWFTLFFCR